MKALKNEIRAEVLARRRSLSPQEVEKRSAVVLKHLYESGLLDGGRTFALFAAADGEVRTRPLFERLSSAGRRVALPRVRGRGPEIDFFPVSDWAGLVVSERGIPEPDGSGRAMAPAEFDFVLVPGVAFDESGGRLGYGMGCYDRFLEGVRPGTPLVGIGYDFQVVKEVPMDEHDVRLSALAIERGLLLPLRRGDAINTYMKGELR